MECNSQNVLLNDDDLRQNDGHRSSKRHDQQNFGSDADTIPILDS